MHLGLNLDWCGQVVVRNAIDEDFDVRAHSILLVDDAEAFSEKVAALYRLSAEEAERAAMRAETPEADRRSR